MTLKWLDCNVLFLFQISYKTKYFQFLVPHSTKELQVPKFSIRNLPFRFIGVQYIVVD